MRGYKECIEYLEKNRNKHIETNEDKAAEIGNSWYEVWMDDYGKLRMCVVHFFFEHGRDPYVKRRSYQPFNSVLEFEECDWIDVVTR